MTGAVIAIDDVELRLDGTRVWLRADGERYEANLRTIGEQAALDALASIQSSIAAGGSLATAIAAVEADEPQRWHMQATAIERGVTIINDAHDATKDGMAAALRSLAQLVPAGSRSVAVLGEFTSDPRDFVEEHDAIGRLVVRLNVGKLVAVGHGARHLQSAAGLEGSWDGESVIVDTPEEAYDLLRDEIRQNDVVLVKSSAAAGLGPLGDKLADQADSESTVTAW